MVEIPDALCTLFSARVEQQGGRCVLEIPSNEVEHDAVRANETYRIAVLESHPSAGATAQQQTTPKQTNSGDSAVPPVEEDELRDVTIKTIGDQGDGIAKVERGYVVIVPGAQPGEQPTVRIDEVRENLAFASIVDSDPQAL